MRWRLTLTELDDAAENNDDESEHLGEHENDLYLGRHPRAVAVQRRQQH